MPLPLALKTVTPDSREAWPFHLAADYHEKHTDEKDLWLVPNLIPHDGTVVLAAAPKKGKTLFANAIARALATGSEFLGHQLPRTPVLWCAYEETPSERLPYLKGLTKEDPFYIGFRPNLPRLDDPSQGLVKASKTARETWETIYHRAGHLGARLVVIDCLQAAVEYTDLANNYDARRLMGAIREYSHHAGCATLVLHHLTKSAHRGYHPERFADSSQLLAAASTHFFLESWQEPGEGWHLRLHGSGRAPIPPRTQDLHSPDPMTYLLPSMEEKGCQTEPRPPSNEDRIREILLEEPDQSAEEIAEALGRSSSLVHKVIAKMPDVIRRWDLTDKVYYHCLESQRALMDEHDRIMSVETTWLSTTPNSPTEPQEHLKESQP